MNSYGEMGLGPWVISSLEGVAVSILGSLTKFRSFATLRKTRWAWGLGYLRPGFSSAKALPYFAYSMLASQVLAA